MSPQSNARRSCLIAELTPLSPACLYGLPRAAGSIVRAKAGEDVVELARRLKPDVIIIDAELPGDIIGWEIMRALQLDEATRHIAQISLLLVE